VERIGCAPYLTDLLNHYFEDVTYGAFTSLSTRYQPIERPYG